ncbi:SDR family NAD(P)-dependent oxidoreductase [Chryseobacterium indologenes]|uniref:SDR family NAD(P)-dependent oxidoreductase n=1 Tax=Chryseobacterium indologenes TaxID=253 RepID=UPI0018888DAA|nr:SDR family oxidoreductase [Chryseobacterium indologenes]MBU3047156.1 SDR family oxidoreductase [Chryseobacterium indologenes]QQQ72388.1 SDR family oxidoreductase [Chryseobacterium indologenes]
MKLENKVVVITGGNSGIGLATAKEFIEQGAHVYITGRRKEQLDEAVKQLGSGVTAVQSDVSNLEDIDKLIAEVKGKHGKIDVLVSNVGIAHFEPLGYISEESFDQLFSTNVKGTVFLVQKALPLMSTGGSIILTGSVNGSKGTPAMSVYSATKAAVRNLARSWALDLKGTGIRVNVLSPGATSTENVVKNLNAIGQFEAISEGIAQQSPLGRFAEPHEVAKAALFLASDDSTFTTGSELFVDGGFGQI